MFSGIVCEDQIVSREVRSGMNLFLAAVRARGTRG